MDKLAGNFEIDTMFHGVRGYLAQEGCPMRKTTVLIAFTILGGLLGSSSVGAQSFGLNDQTTTIGASAFRPASGANVGYSYDLSTDGYLHGDGQYVAPLDLPEGAEIVGICVDVNGEDGGEIGAFLEAVQLSADGVSGGVYAVPGGNAQIVVLPMGFTSACNDSPLDYVFRSAGDLGSGVRNLTYRIRYFGIQAALGAVRIRWHRQVSPAPATATFNDVPTTDGAFAFIEALVAAGVTSGCGGGNYCPDNPVTRRQMAVFLSKALGLHWPN